MELTNKEVQLLTQFYNNPLEVERIRNNHLYDYQQKTLDEIRSFITYLEDKYQCNAFEMNRFEVATTDTSSNFYVFTYLQEPIHYHGILDENGEFKDDFYGYHLSQEFDMILNNLLSDYCVVAIHTFFKTLYHETIIYDESLLTSKKPIRDIEIFIKANQDFIVEIRSLLEKYSYKGNYRIYSSNVFDQSFTLDECWQMWKDHPDLIQAVAFRIG